MASSIVNFFKKKQANKQGGYELEAQKLQRGKQGRTASFRLSLYRKQSPPETRQRLVAQADEEHGNNGQIQLGHLPYRSPYDVVTEPKTKRAIRSCPGGPTSSSGHGNVGTGTGRKFSPSTAAILEQSGSYENFPTVEAEKEEELEQEQQERNHVVAGEGLRKAPMRKRPELPQRHQLGQVSRSSNRNTQRTAALNNNVQQQPRHQMSTSEYGSGSTEPSPVNEQQHQQQAVQQRQAAQQPAGGHFQPHLAHQNANFAYNNGNGTRHSQRGGGYYGIMPENNTSDDGEEDDSSDEEDRLSSSFLQFWQHQVKVLKKEVRTYRGEFEKYRSKYHRLKSRTEDLAMELTRERERNISLFNQLLIANDKIVQLAQFQNQNHQQPQNAQMTPASAGGVGPSPSNAFGQFGQLPLRPPFFTPSRPYGAGESQCAARELQQHGSNSSAGSDAEFGGQSPRKRAGNNGSRAMGQMSAWPEAFGQNAMPPLFFAPPPDNSFLNGLNLNCSGLSAAGMEVPRSSMVDEQQQGQGEQAVHQQHHVLLNDESPLKLDLTNIQLAHQQPLNNDDCLLNNTDESVIIHLDQCFEGDGDFNSSMEETGKGQQKFGPISRFGRLSFSSDDLSSMLAQKRDGEMARKKKYSAAVAPLSSSDDDVARLWTKQLAKRGDRVLFRPPRKNFIVGINEEKAAARIFKRFGKSEREAMSKFDYLRDEKSDVSGLVSSPEKANKEEGGSSA